MQKDNESKSIEESFHLRSKILGGVENYWGWWKLLEGVENMRFVFGLDTDSDSRVDSYRSIEDMQHSDWENRKSILTVQVFLLVRACLKKEP